MIKNRFVVGAAIPLCLATSSGAQMVTGAGMPGYNAAFGLVGEGRIRGLAARIVAQPEGNVLWPGEKGRFTYEFANSGDSPVAASGSVKVIAYGTKGMPGDIWVPHVVKLGDAGSVPVKLHIPAKGKQTVTFTVPVPERFGGYALVLDLGAQGRQYLTSCARTFAPAASRVQFPTLSLDDIGVDVLKKLGVHAVRWGLDHRLTTDPDFPRYLEDKARQLKEFNDAGVTVLAMVGGGAFFADDQPLGRPRPWLDDKGVMMDTKFDLAWKPEHDADFRKFVSIIAGRFGWPKGPITAFSLWNEPWEGISISGWGADSIRFREMYRAMADGVIDARKKDRVDVLVGGGDSSSNALDKLFADGSDRYLPVFDFLSVHYQGMNSFATYKKWRDRKAPSGRVRIWDTESWVANTDDRVAAVMAANRASGYDRAMGVFGGNIADQQDGGRQAYSTAAAVGAAVHFLGDRPFLKLLYPRGLPWVMVFGGVKNPEDGTVVVVGDLGEEFGARNLPLRTARGLVEKARKETLWKQYWKATDPGVRSKLRAKIEADEVLSGSKLSLARSPDYSLFDFYGNPVAATRGKIEIPLDGRGFFLRAKGSKGSFSRLLAALQRADIVGIEPVAIVAKDMLARIEQKPTLRLSLTNVLNKPVVGRLSVSLGGLVLTYPKGAIAIGPSQTREIDLKVVGGKPDASNTYPLTVAFRTNRGVAKHWEEMRCNVVHRRTVAVDGDLNDWKGTLPQTVLSPEANAPTTTEAAWYPFRNFDQRTRSGLATAYLAADDRNFYFAAKVADDTPDAGMLRMENRDDDQFFYPQTSYVKRLAKPGIAPVLPTDTDTPQPLEWPAGVRRYSYRKDPFLPAGNASPWCDNVQIAFNVLPEDQKAFGPAAAGTMPGFVNYQCTDYEYALNPISPLDGGGTEIWRLRAPGMPLKHHYPRQPKSPMDGPVKTGKLVVKRVGNTIITEAAIPWSEIPWVKKRLDAGQPIKFSYRTNNNVAGSCMELARRRSVSKAGSSFQVDWTEHWANEVAFALEPKVRK